MRMHTVRAAEAMVTMRTRRQAAARLAGLAVLATGSAAIGMPMMGMRSARAAGVDSADGVRAGEASGDVWNRIRASAFESRPVQTDGADRVLSIDAPPRAEDAAIVPIAIRAAFDQTPARWVRRVHLVIDGNPSPLSARMTFGQHVERAEIETRVRIEQYSTLRAIAELNDDSLHMVTRFIKASGGCSAPAGKDPAAARATLGQMRLRVDADVAQLQVSHPNDSGLVMDQVTRNYTPAWFVRTVAVCLDDRPVFEIDTDFTISQNPNFRFRLPAAARGTLTVRAVDTQDAVFEKAWPLPMVSRASIPGQSDT